MHSSFPTGALLVALLFPAQVRAQDPGAAAPPQDLTGLSLEELMNVDVLVTSAALHEQALSKTPAAIFVLTSEDIRRSGATSIPELLRLVPGVDVARLDSNRWAVSIRGFNGQFANKILVLVDGRSVYTPLFSGTFWDTLDVPLENIERIEVIRGPGASLWGANAVNGVVNIITKDASATQGTLVSTTLGDQDRFLGFVRYGAAMERGHWNAWAHTTDRGPTGDPAGGDGTDAWKMFHAGFRIDQAPDERDRWMLTGEAYSGAVDSRETLAAPAPQYSFTGLDHSHPWGATLVGRWTRSFGARDELSLQGYADHTDRRLMLFVEERTTGGFEFRRRQPLSQSQDLTWGAALRSSHSMTEDTFVLGWRDNHRLDTLLSAFVQDEIVLAPERWALTLGSKVEHVDFSGWNLQPDLRLLFTPSAHETWWASASRAVRTPSQVEQDVSLVNAVIPGAPDQVITLVGDRGVDPETLDSFQLGCRTRPGERFSFDATAYYNHYRDQIVFEPDTPYLSGGNLIVPLVARNLTEAHSYGVELASDWAPRDDTLLSFAWSAQKIQVDAHGSAATDAQADEGSAPQHMLRLGLRHDADERLSFDGTLYWIDRLTTDSVPSYWRLDARVEYRPGPHQSFALGVQNLFHDGQAEFGPDTFNRSNTIDPALYLRASWSF
jgi:iron complex outermembrane receptor protein